LGSVTSLRSTITPIAEVSSRYLDDKDLAPRTARVYSASFEAMTHDVGGVPVAEITV
jgi:hypothetical protein